VLPGSNESGVLLSAKVSVPPFVVDGFTTPVRAALNAAAPPVLGLLLLAPLLALGLEPPAELLLEQAAKVSPVSTTAHAATAIDLGLFISGTSPFAGKSVYGLVCTRIERVTEAVTE
jgi:hypothetical protein